MILCNPVSPTEEMLGVASGFVPLILAGICTLVAIFLIVRAAKKKTFYPDGGKSAESKEQQEDTTHDPL